MGKTSKPVKTSLLIGFGALLMKGYELFKKQDSSSQVLTQEIQPITTKGYTNSDLATRILYTEPTEMNTPWGEVEKGHIIGKVALAGNHWSNDINHVDLTERIRRESNPTHFVYLKPLGHVDGAPIFELSYMPIEK